MKKGESPCQICGFACREVVLNLYFMKGVKTDKGDEIQAYWEHVSSDKFVKSKFPDHPPYPAAEHSKEDAQKDYEKWKKEYKVS